jgi:hypothetical protein
MSKPHNHKPVPLSPDPRRRLLRWLREWAVLQALETDDAAVPVGEDREPPLAIFSEPPPMPLPTSIPRPGEIRLLQPRSTAAPVFVAIAGPLPGQPADACLCVPFGRLTEPATPDELASGRAEAPVQVLCLWNARLVAPEQLAGSWIADRLANEARERLDHAMLAWQTTGSVPAELRDAIGPPLYHPDDPRRVYRYLERQRISEALAAAPRANIIDYPSGHERQSLPQAAEDRDPYGN